MSFEQATHNEINETVKKAKEDDGRLTEADREKQEISRSVNFIKRMYNPETDQEDAEARNIVLVGINKAAVINNTDPQEVADLIYGKGVINVEKLLNDSWTNDYARFRDGHVPPGTYLTNERIREYETDPKTKIDVQRLLVRATPQDVLSPVFWKMPNGTFALQIFRYNELFGLPIRRKVKDFAEANNIIRKEIQRLREEKKYKVSELDNTPDNSEGRRGQEKKPKEGSLNVNPDGRGEGGIDRENLDFSKLLDELGKTKNEQWAFEQLDMLGDYDSGASQEVIQQAVINILRNQNIEHQPRNLARIFRRFGNNQEIMKEFWNLPKSKLTAFVQELAKNHISDKISYKNLLGSYNKLPDKYKNIYLAEFDKKYFPAKKALQGFLRELNRIAETQIVEKYFFDEYSGWHKSLPEKYITRESSKGEKYSYINRKALEKDGLSFSDYDKYYMKFAEWAAFKRKIQ